MSIRALLQVPEKPNNIRKLTRLLEGAPPVRMKPAEAIKMYGEKIASIVDDEKNA